MTAPDLLRQLADCMEEKERLEVENAALKAELADTKRQVPTEQKEWFTTSEAAKYIGRSVGHMQKNREAIPFRQDGFRTIRYSRTDLDKYIEVKKQKKEKKRC